MRATIKQFFKGNANLEVNNCFSNVDIYSYETRGTNSHLYDICTVNGVRYYLINQRVSKQTPIHRAIESHFELEPPTSVAVSGIIRWRIVSNLGVL